MDTIFAQATAPGRAGVAVIRVSGPEATRACRDLCGDLPQSHLASLRTLRDVDGSVLDRGVVVYFPAGRSFTGEDVVEFQLHGSIAVVNAVNARLTAMEGTRPALPGEFTRRALDNDRMTLPEVEALADLIDSETELQRRQAQHVMGGALESAALRWRSALVEAGALVAVTIDFADEEVPVDVSPQVRDLLTGVLRDLKAEIDGFGAVERLRGGYEVAILGAPNAGKSSLLNAIARRQVALTSEIAGTTRDVIEVRVDLGGLPVTLLDTAGLRETEDRIERAGIELARARARSADLRVFLSDDGIFPSEAGEDDLLLRSKSDLHGARGISATTGEGIEELLETIRARLVSLLPGVGLAIRERHRDAMAGAATELHMALNAIDSADHTELVSHHISLACRALDELMGRVDVEDLLDTIFSSFCIGK